MTTSSGLTILRVCKNIKIWIMTVHREKAADTVKG